MEKLKGCADMFKKSLILFSISLLILSSGCTTEKELDFNNQTDKNIVQDNIDKLSEGVLSNNIDLVEKILKDGFIDVNQKDSEGNYPIEVVLIMENCEMASILLEAGADPSIITSDGSSVYDKVMESDNLTLKSIFEDYKK
jgi:ankyrin repeat protein